MLKENPAEVLGRKPAAPKPYECMGLSHDDADATNVMMVMK